MRQMMNAPEPVVCSEEEYALLAAKALERLHKTVEKEGNSRGRKTNLLRQLSRKREIWGVAAQNLQTSSLEDYPAAVEISDEEYAQLARMVAEQMAARQQTGKKRSEEITVCSDEEYIRLTDEALNRVRSDEQEDRKLQEEQVPSPISAEQYAQLSEETAVQIEAQQAKAERFSSLINSPIAYSVVIVCILSISLWIGMHRGVDVQNRQRRAHLGTHRSHHQDTLDDTGQ